VVTIGDRFEYFVAEVKFKDRLRFETLFFKISTEGFSGVEDRVV
jgi:hypothetical protein